MSLNIKIRPKGKIYPSAPNVLIPPNQNISQLAKCPNTPKSKHVSVGKIYPIGQNNLILPKLHSTIALLEFEWFITEDE